MGAFYLITIKLFNDMPDILASEVLEPITAQEEPSAPDRTIESFLTEVNSVSQSDGTDLDQTVEQRLINDFDNIIDESAFFELLTNSIVNKVKIVKVEVKEETAVLDSLKRMKMNYAQEMSLIKQRLENYIKTEIERFKTIKANQAIGHPLLTLSNLLSDINWALILKGSSVFAYRYFKVPYKAKVTYHSGENRWRIYKEPFVEISGIYVNLLHSKLNSSTVQLVQTVGRHPNASAEGVSSVCLGEFERKAIDITNAESLRQLLMELESTYLIGHTRSPYWTPDYTGDKATVVPEEEARAFINDFLKQETGVWRL